MTIYDVIIVGSGIAGLYAALTIKKHNPSLSILVLEKHKKQWIGGRANNEPFYGAQIATGAGIGRKRDKLLKSLVQEFGFPINEFKVTPSFSKYIDPVDVKDVLSTLREAYQKYKGPPITFEMFAKPVLGESKYKQFLLSSGYTDYEKSGVEETLYDYGMEDNACCLTGFGVDWHNLIKAMASKIGDQYFRFSQNVTKITKTMSSSHTPIFLLETEYGKSIFKCRKVIVATTITGLRELFPTLPIYREIEGQPFLRIYGKFAKSSIPTLKEYIAGGHIATTGHIQKMIAINPDTGVYMIVYNDNRHAMALKSRTENTAANRDYYCDLIERTLGIPENKRVHLIAIRSFYWKVGTHYYKPLLEQSGIRKPLLEIEQSGIRKPLLEQSGIRKPLNTTNYKTRDEFIDAAQHPDPDGDILVVGEVVSKHQGWTEGALESVGKVVTKKWVNS